MLGGIVFALGGVVAATVISSNQVTYQNKTVNNALDELYDEAVTGKELIAAAITNKGITTTSSDTYEVMAANINNIDTDHTEIIGKINNLESKHNSDITSLTGTVNNLNQSLSDWKQKSIRINSSAITNVAGQLLVNEKLHLAIFSLEFLTSINGVDLTLFNPENDYYPKYGFNIGISAYNGGKNGILYATPTGFKCLLTNTTSTWYHVFFVYIF